MRQFYDTGASPVCEKIFPCRLEHKQIANAGIRPSRHGLEEQGFRNLNVAYWNLGTAQLLEHAIQRREGNLASGGSFVVRTGQFTGRSPKDKFIVRDETTDAHVNWGDVNQPLSDGPFRPALRQDDGLLAGPRRLCAGLLRRRRPGIRDAHPGGEPAGVAQSLRAAAFHPAGPGTDRRSRAAVFDSFRARFPGQPGRRRHQLGNLHRDQFQEARGADLRHQLRRGNEEVGLHDPELPAAGTRRVPHALLGEHGRGGRRGAVLRTLRHRQDHALGRCRAPADRRRRARLERQRRVQFRGRLLRQVHTPLRGERTADLERDPLRHGAGERGDGFGDAAAGFQFATRSRRTRARPIR